MSDSARRCGSGPVLLLALLAWPERAEPQPVPVIRTTLDATGQVGRYSSIAVGADGLGLISYYNETNRDLKVAHCSNVECTAATVTTLDSAGDVGEYTSITIGADGRGLIAYYDRTNGDLKTAHCANAACTTATIRTVDSAGDVGMGTAIVTGSDGRGLIGYSVVSLGGPGGGLKVAHCLDADCGSAVVTAYPGPGGRVDWMVGADGFGLAVDVSGDAFGPLVRAVHCSNLDCSAATLSTIVPSGGVTSMSASIVRDGNGLGFISLSQFSFPTTLVLRAGTCVDTQCTSVPFVQVSVGGSASIGSEGFPLLSGSGLNVHDCLDPGCAASVSNRIDVFGNEGPSLAMGADQRPLLSYWNRPQDDLKVVHCTNADCLMTGADLYTPMPTDITVLVPGQSVNLGGAANNLGPDTEPEATLTFNVPSRFLVQEIMPGPPICNLAAGVVACRFPNVAPPGAGVAVNAIVDHGGAEVLHIVRTVSGTSFDLDPSNNQSTHVYSVMASCLMSDVSVQEGDGGSTEAVFTVRRHPSLVGMQQGAFYHTDDQTATAGVDYTATSGLLTFAVGQEEATISVPVLGDGTIEPDERFQLTLDTVPQPCGMTQWWAYATILDDDAPSLSARELSHGSSEWHAMGQGRGAGKLGDLYRLRQAPFASYAIVVDAASGDMPPFAVQRLASDNVSVLGSSLSLGTTATLSWENDAFMTIDNQHVNVVSSGCAAAACGPDDLYRIRAYETTASIPRFNNGGGQVSVLILQNTTAAAAAGHVRFWSAAGGALAVRPFSLGPLASLVLNTTTVPGLTGVGGSVTVSHDGPYGALAGKVIALEPATGFSFDSPLVNRPR